MSEPQQPIQETPATTTTEPAVAAETTDKVAPAEGVTDLANINAAPPVAPKEEKVGKNEVKIEAQPVNEGVLNYKGPGLKGLIFSKKYFWFSEDALEQSHLTSYLGAEKNKDVAHANAAHASQTGKGLLFFAKRVEDKDHPQGILNLADLGEIAKGSFNDFSTVLNGHKHTFQALSKAERDGWLVALDTKITTSKSDRELLVGTAGYKSALEKYTKPVTTAATPKPTSAKKEKSSKSRERVKDVVSKATGKDASKDTPKEIKGDKPAVVTETAAPAPTESAAPPTTSGPVEGVSSAAVKDSAVSSGSNVAGPADTAVIDKPAEGVTENPADSKGEEVAAGAAVGAAAAGTATVATRKGSSEDEKVKSKKSRSQSRGNKRGSIFGALLGKKDDAEEKLAAKKEEKEEKKEIKAAEKTVKQDEKKEEQAVKAEEKKEEEAIVAAEKKIEDQEKKIEKEEKKAEKEESKAEKEEKKEEKAAEKKEEHKAKAGEAAAAAAVAKAEATGESTTTTPTTKDKSAKRGSVFGGLFKPKDTPKLAAEGTPATAATKEEPTTVSSTAPQLENPVTSPTEPITTETSSKPDADPAAVAAAVAATKESETKDAPKTTTTLSDKRRTSFFGGIGSKKEKKAGATSGDELTDGESKKPSGGITGLLRKASRAAPKGEKPSTAAAPAVPSSKPAEPTDVPLPKEETAAEPEALTNGEAATAQAPAEEPTTSAMDKPAEGAKTVEATA